MWVLSLQIITTWSKVLRTGKISGEHILLIHVCMTELALVLFHSSSGETVTSVVSVSPALPKKERRYRKKRSRDYQEEIPPEIPAKGTNVWTVHTN